MSTPDLSTLADLARDIAAKRGASPEESYTAKLLQQGVEKCAKKFGEEAVELALASVSGKADHTKAEAADVLYHLLVFLVAQGIEWKDVERELEARFGVSGLVEKAQRRPETGA